MSRIKDVLYSKQEIESFGFTDAEFAKYLETLMLEHPDYRNVSPAAIIATKKGSYAADLSAERSKDGKFCLIECLSDLPGTQKRIEEVISKLVSFKDSFPLAELIVAFPGQLSNESTRELQGNGIVIWDSRKLAYEFVDQIGKRGNDPHSVLIERTKKDPPASKEKTFISELRTIEPGLKDWKKFEDFTGIVLSHLFSPPLSAPIPQSRDQNGHNRRDFVFPNYSSEGFWNYLRSKYEAEYVLVDAKNSSNVKKEDILQVSNYLKQHGLGLFALVVCRADVDTAASATIREIWIAHRKLILIVNDRDIEQMLIEKESGNDPVVIIRQKIEDFRMSL